MPINNKIFVTQPVLLDFNDVQKQISEIWDSKCLTNMGEKHKELEKNIFEFIGNIGKVSK